MTSIGAYYALIRMHTQRSLQLAQADSVQRMHSLAAVVFSVGVAALAVGCICLLIWTVRRASRRGLRFPVRVVVIESLLVAVLWAISGVVYCGDIAALLGWSNPIEGISGIVIGASAAAAGFIAASTSDGSTTTDTQGLGKALLILVGGGLLALVLGFGLTELIKTVDPSAVNN